MPFHPCQLPFSHDVTYKTTDPPEMSKSCWKTNTYTKFCSELALGFVIDYTWISKLLRDAAFVCVRRPRELLCWLKKWLFSWNLAIWIVLVLERVFFYCFWVPCEINSSFYNKTQWRTFLLVSGRHVGAHPDGHHHCVSIQLSIKLGKIFLHISCIRKIAVTWILVRVFA